METTSISSTMKTDIFVVNFAVKKSIGSLDPWQLFGTSGIACAESIRGIALGRPQGGPATSLARSRLGVFHFLIACGNLGGAWITLSAL